MNLVAKKSFEFFQNSTFWSFFRNELVVVVVASGQPTGFTPYPTMDSLSAFSSEWQVSGT